MHSLNESCLISLSLMSKLPLHELASLDELLQHIHYVLLFLRNLSLAEVFLQKHEKAKRAYSAHQIVVMMYSWPLMPSAWVLTCQ